MKNKGFTLIELLAVIVILAIIALIATPMILGVIDTAKRGSAESAALGYVDAVEKSVMIEQIKPDSTMKIVAGVEYTVTSTGSLTYTADGKTYTVNVDVKGEKPSTSSTIKFKNTSGEVSEAKLTFTKIHANQVTYTPSTGAKIANS